MEISEVRVKLVENKDDRLKAFCSVTLDDEFVVRDIGPPANVQGVQAEHQHQQQAGNDTCQEYLVDTHTGNNSIQQDCQTGGKQQAQ